MSLRGRLLVALLVTLVVGLVVADAATYVALRSFLLNQVDEQLHEFAMRGVMFTSRPESGPGGFSSSGRGGTLRLPIEGGAIGFVQIRDRSGAVIEERSTEADIFGSRPTPALPDPLPSPPPQIQVDPPPRSGPPGDPGRALPVDTRLTGTYLTVGSNDAGGPPFRVRITRSPWDDSLVINAISLDGVEATLHNLVAIELVVTASVLGLSALTGLWLVRLGLRPLADIGATAAEIAAGDLAKRVQRDDQRTEIGRLGRSLNTMLHQIETAFDERQRSEAALRNSEERLRRFVADASHELRTPLAAVQAYAELFDRAAAEHPEDLPRLLHNIQKESGRMAVLVDDLLLLTRLDQGRPLDRKPVDLGAIAADAVEAARAVDTTRPVTLHTNGSVEVSGDRVRLRQVADNLIANTRVHTPPGTAVEVEVRSEDGLGVLEVIDHGPGLDGEQTTKVFERFYRADPSRSRADGGTGLGLSIVSAIAQAHGGTADACPTPGGGATFRVMIPLLDAG